MIQQKQDESWNWSTIHWLKTQHFRSPNDPTAFQPNVRCPLREVEDVAGQLHPGGGAGALAEGLLGIASVVKNHRGVRPTTVTKKKRWA